MEKNIDIYNKIENCPKNCKDCCSYNDNKFMESLWKTLKFQDDVDDIQFFFEY